MTLKIALMQVKVGRSPRESLESAYRLLDRLRGREIDVILFPEGWASIEPPQNRPDPAADAEALIEWCSALAQEYGAWILGGGIYVRREGDLYVSCPVVDDSGNIIAWQDKVHLYWTESRLFKPGASLRPVRIKGVPSGLLVCHDIAYPEAARSLVLRGAEIIYNPSKIVETGLEAWHLYLKVRSLENRVPVYGANIWSEPRFKGGSAAVKPLDSGEGIFIPRLSLAAPGEAVLIDEVDPSVFQSARRERLSKRVPTVYVGWSPSRESSGGK